LSRLHHCSGVEDVDAVHTEQLADSSSKEDTAAANAFIEFGDDDEDFDVDEVRRRQDEEFDFSAMMRQSAADSKHKESSQGPLLHFLAA